jgi:signal transduction histidine kinase
VDLRKRLIILTLCALFVAVAGATGITNYILQQQAQQQAQLDDQRGLVGASNIAANAIADELSRIQVAAKYLALNPDVLSALQRRTPGAVQDNLLEPYRASSTLTFISLVTNTPRSQIAQAKVLSPPEVPSIAIVNDALHLQQDRSGIWDGPVRPADAFFPQVPYAVAVSPVLFNNTVIGAVVVGHIFDNYFVTARLTNNLGDFQAAIVNNDLALALPTELDRAFAEAQAYRPYRPQVTPASRSIPLPNGSWHAVNWQIGSARYLVVTRPLGFGSKDQLAITQVASAPSSGKHAILTPLSVWLAQRLGTPATTAFLIVTQIIWWLALLLLFGLVGGLVSLMIHSFLRPLRRLTQQVEAFEQTQKWAAEPPGGGTGDLGRLRGAVGALASEAAGWSAELTVYRNRLQAVLDSMGTGVVVSDSNGRVELINPAARELLGIDPGAAALPVPMTRSSSGQAFQATNGRVINAVSTPIRSSDGETLGLVTVLEDMTREHELERVRSDFLTVVSHELRTPLTAVKGSLDLLLDGDAGTLDPLQQRFLHTARRNTERLIGLVADLLDLSRLEAGQVRLTLQPADIRRMVDDVVLGLATIFDSKRQAVHLEMPPQPVLVLVDRRRFEQVITNLLGNAASYTPEEGRIEVQAQPDLLSGQAILTVRNSGPGIAPEDREHLFEKFYRGGNALTRQDGGSGLGLAIVKSLVDLHHGTIAVESEPGNGAAFIVRLPLVGDERENTGRR